MDGYGTINALGLFPPYVNGAKALAIGKISITIAKIYKMGNPDLFRISEYFHHKIDIVAAYHLQSLGSVIFASITPFIFFNFQNANHLQLSTLLMTFT